MQPSLSRRQFIHTATLAAGAAALAGCATPPRGPRRIPPGAKLKLGIIGCGGKGWGDLEGVAGEDIVALCDVDERALQHAAKRIPGARLFRDYRVMLAEVADLDGVTVSIPDHQHAPAALRAMARGLHVYVQKPLTHTVREARLMAEAARRHGVATQMGNQGASSHAAREFYEWMATDPIGPVRELHAWTDRPIWPQGKDRPAGADPVPAHLDWDLWLGPAPDPAVRAALPRCRPRRLSPLLLARLVGLRHRRAGRHRLPHPARAGEGAGARPAGTGGAGGSVR
jgi:hypothetical protein